MTPVSSDTVTTSPYCPGMRKLLVAAVVLMASWPGPVSAGGPQVIPPAYACRVVAARRLPERVVERRCGAPARAVVLAGRRADGRWLHLAFWAG